jgi:hypothetical protein
MGLPPRFADISEGKFSNLLFVPMYVVWKHAAELRKVLITEGVDGATETKFAWQHLKDHFDHCCVLMDGRGIEITPPLIPLSGLPYFANDVRRVYLTATMPSQTSFVRTFGVADPTVIQPSGKSGDAQRLLLFVDGEDDGAQRRAAIELTTGRKCCVISPSRRKGSEWVPPARLYDSQAGHDEIERFANSKEAEMLAFVARYDGLDLPGDACKVLILAGLPTGEAMIDRFIDESIRIEAMRVSHTATRITVPFCSSGPNCSRG